MYISQEQLKSRLAGQSNLELRGREGVGRHKTIPHETKVLIGVLAKTDSQENVARAFGTSQENVSMISRGLSGPNVNDKLKEDIQEATPSKVREQVSSKAIDVLMKSIGVVEDKIGSTKTAADASIVAKNMAVIADKFGPRSDSPSGFAPKIQINIHGSKQKDESAYETIEVESVSA